MTGPILHAPMLQLEQRERDAVGRVPLFVTERNGRQRVKRCQVCGARFYSRGRWRSHALRHIRRMEALSGRVGRAPRYFAPTMTSAELLERIHAEGAERYGIAWLGANASVIHVAQVFGLPAELAPAFLSSLALVVCEQGRKR